MPFKKHAKITMENRDDEPMTLYYQIDYTLTQVPDDIGYFHAQFRRTNPLPYKEVYTIVDGIEARANMSVPMAWGVNNNSGGEKGDKVLYGQRQGVSHQEQGRGLFLWILQF